MPADNLRYAQAREHLNRLVGLYASTEDDAENSHILRDIEWLVEQMAQMSSAEFLDTMSLDEATEPQQLSSEPSRRTAA